MTDSNSYNRTNQPPANPSGNRSASIYQNVQNVTLSGGVHTNAGRNIIDIQTSGRFDPALVQNLVKKAGKLTDKYAKNANAHAYTGYRNGTIAVDRLENAAGGKFTFDLGDGSSNKFDTIEDLKDEREDSDDDQAGHPSHPEYSAKVFNSAEGNQRVGTVLNAGFGHYKMSSKAAFAVSEAMMQTNREFGSSYTAEHMHGEKFDNLEMESVKNVAGLEFDADACGL